MGIAKVLHIIHGNSRHLVWLKTLISIWDSIIQINTVFITVFTGNTMRLKWRKIAQNLLFYLWVLVQLHNHIKKNNNSLDTTNKIKTLNPDFTWRPSLSWSMTKCISIDKNKKEQTFSLKFYSLEAYFGHIFNSKGSRLVLWLEFFSFICH